MMENKNTSQQLIIVEAEHHGARLDQCLARSVADYSRTRLAALVREGAVVVNNVVGSDPAQRVNAGDRITLSVPVPIDATPIAQDLPINVLYEDDDLLVINKQAGMIVHQGAGARDGTLVNALLHHCRGDLSGIGGVARPGIVHRLDKDTSGVMIVAKNDRTHRALQSQIENRDLVRIYHALVLHAPVPSVGTIDRPIGRHPTHRLKQAVRGRDGRPARTHYKILEAVAGGALSLVECRLETGRTHQIRVHMESIKHPLIGDPLYGPAPTAVRAALKKQNLSPEIIEQVIAFPRQALQAMQLTFDHPVTDERMTITAPMADDLLVLLRRLHEATLS